MGANLGKISSSLKKKKSKTGVKELLDTPQQESEHTQATKIFVNIYDDEGSLTQDDLDLVEYFQEIYPMIQFTVFLEQAHPIPTEVKNYPSVVMFHNKVPSKRDILNLFKLDEID